MRRALVLGALLALAACDDKPNAAFEQQMKDKQAEQAGDAYSQLESALPQRRWYDASKDEQFVEQVKGSAGTYRATYDGLLTRLDGDRGLAHGTALFAACRPAFAAASAYQSGSGDDPAAAAKARMTALAGLRDCRKQAKGTDDRTAGLLRRFASAGIVLVGVKTVAQGAQDEGFALWSEGERRVSEDRPGFQFGIKSFRGY